MAVHGDLFANSASMHLHVLMNANQNHDDAKAEITRGYGITHEGTLQTWVLYILEFAHVWIWSQAPI